VDKVRIGWLAIFLGLIATLILSLFLVFAKNEDLPLLKSTGLGLLGIGGEEIVQVNKNTGKTYIGREDFFENVYGYNGSDFDGVSVVVKIIYRVFCLLGVVALVGALVSIFLKTKWSIIFLILAFCEVLFGFALTAIALICVIFPSIVYNLSYSTQYYFLFIPLAATIAAAIITVKNSRMTNNKNV